MEWHVPIYADGKRFMIKEIFPVKIYTVQFPNYEEIQESLEAEIRSFFGEDPRKFGNHRLFNKSFSKNIKIQKKIYYFIYSSLFNFFCCKGGQ